MVCPDENMLAVIDNIARRFIDVGVAPAAKFRRPLDESDMRAAEREFYRCSKPAQPAS